MHIKDGIYYADEKADCVKVVDCKPLEGMMLLVTFSNGERKLFDCTSLNGSAFEPLKNKKLFENIEIKHGFISWDSGNIDISPEKLYEDGFAYEII